MTGVKKVNKGMLFPPDNARTGSRFKTNKRQYYFTGFSNLGNSLPEDFVKIKIKTGFKKALDQAWAKDTSCAGYVSPSHWVGPQRQQGAFPRLLCPCTLLRKAAVGPFVLHKL